MDVKKIIGKALVFVGAFAGAKLAQKGVEKYIDKPEEDNWDDDDYEGSVPTDEEIEKIVNFEEKEDEEKTDD